MTTRPEIVLYDLACTKNVCFSPAVWRTRLILNYKKIPYTTVFLEFPDIAPTLKSLNIKLPEATPGSSPPKYTVPAIHHIPTNTFMMDSVPISQFLETTYPEPTLTLTSDLGTEITARARAVSNKAFGISIPPREDLILPPRSQEYFRKVHLGGEPQPIDPELEERNWEKVDEEMRAVGALMLTHKDEGPFILGAEPSFADFFVAGSLQAARVVDEGVFQRCYKYPGFKDVYDACLPYLERNT